jgi:energy-coupling factor transporter ATP-binding protein EcfA2
MPNPIKYTTGSETDALKKGNFYIGTGDVGKGPSDVTGYYQGISPSEGGYVIYMNREGAPGDLSYHNAPTDSELITFTNNLAGQSYTTVNECLVYYAGQSDKVVLNRDYEGIVTDGLVLNLDAGFTPSYPKSGTTWTDLSLSGNNGTLTNGPTFSADGGGTIVFDGVDDYVAISDSTSLNITGSISMEILFKTPRESITERLITKELFVGTFGLGYQLSRYSSDRMLATYNNGNTRIFLYSNKKASDFFSNYTHVIYTYNGSNSQKMWINGVDESGQNQFISNFTAGSTAGVDLNIMRRGRSQEEAQGTIAYTRLYNKGLSQSEVLQNYNATKGRFGL